MLCHNWPWQNNCDSHYYPDNHQTMLKTLIRTLKHTKSTFPYILFWNKRFYCIADRTHLFVAIIFLFPETNCWLLEWLKRCRLPLVIIKKSNQEINKALYVLELTAFLSQTWEVSHDHPNSQLSGFTMFVIAIADKAYIVPSLNKTVIRV